MGAASSAATACSPRSLTKLLDVAACPRVLDDPRSSATVPPLRSRSKSSMRRTDDGAAEPMRLCQQHGALAVSEIVARRLPRQRRVAERTQQVHRGAGTRPPADRRRPRTTRVVPRLPRPGPRRTPEGPEVVLAAVFASATRQASSTRNAPTACVTKSKYWPRMISSRIASNTEPPRCKDSIGSPLSRRSSSAQTRQRSPARIAAAIPNSSGGPRQPLATCTAAKR
jgi:hypothetical protein